MPLQINQFPKHFLSTTYLPGLIEIKLGDLWGAYGDLVIPLFPYYISFARTSSISPLNWAEMLVSTFLMTFPNGYILHLGSWHHEKYPTMIHQDENDSILPCAGNKISHRDWGIALIATSGVLCPQRHRNSLPMHGWHEYLKWSQLWEYSDIYIILTWATMKKHHSVQRRFSFRFSVYVLCRVWWRNPVYVCKFVCNTGREVKVLLWQA